MVIDQFIRNKVMFSTGQCLAKVYTPQYLFVLNKFRFWKELNPELLALS